MILIVATLFVTLTVNVGAARQEEFISEVALALLPFGIDIGERLKFENYEFSYA